MRSRSAIIADPPKEQRVRNRRSGVTVLAPAPVEAVVQLLPYQRRWIEDDSTLKIVVKGRQTGFSFSATLRAVLRRRQRRPTWILLSKGERQ